MKKLLLILMTAMGIFVLFTSNTIAQDFCKTDPSFHKVLVDNEHITATEVTYKPGKQTNLHSHPGAFIYALTDGALIVTDANGETFNFELKKGDSLYEGPQAPHRTVNTGKKTVKILLVELKSQPYMAAAKMK